MFKFKYHIIILALLAFGTIVGGVYFNIKDFEKVYSIDTEGSVGNSSPAINQTPADDSDASPPTNEGSNITFTGKAIDVNGDNYYMAFCSSDQVTHGGASAPTCNTDDEWVISGSTASNVAISSVTYQTGTNSNAETNDCTSGESCPWYAFACDAVTGGSCYPANGSGDQGFAVGTITFSDVPADEDDITIDSVIYEFDTTDGATCTGGEDVCVDISVSASEQDAAQELADAETGASSHMTARGAVVYVYADSEGTGGNSIGMTIGTCANCALSGSTLAGGSATGQSPFKINHAPTFGTVSVTDLDGGDIQPGDILRFTLAQADIADSDTDGTQDTINMYICTDATSSFNYSTNACTGGSLICSDTAVNPTNTDATCDESANNLVPPSDTHGTENFKVYVEDSHDFAGTGTNQQSYIITNTAPTHDSPELDVHAPTLPTSVGHWQFEDGSSATAFDDETSNGNDGSCTNCPDWDEEGYSGGAYDFNGTNDYIDMGDQDSLDFGTGDFTLSAWVNTTSSANPMVVAGKYSAYPLYNIRVNGGVFHSWIAYDSNNSIYSTDGSAINDGGWHHIVAVFDRDGNMTRYVDGSAYGSTDSISGLSSYNIDNANTFRVGATTGQYFDGLIDEVHVYNRALTADEIEAMYNDTTSGDADLVSEWTFNDGPGGITQALNINVEGNWDTTRAESPTVIKDGDTYKMWYSGFDSTNYRILYTTSTNGTTWTTPVQALNINQEGNWDTVHASYPTVIKDGNIYKMWYSGFDSTNYRILYTTSTNGTTWTTPVQALNINQEGNWDTTHIAGPAVIKDGNTYKMWYSGSDGSNWRTLYTTSANGTTWTTPVQALNINLEGNWDTVHADFPDVIKDGNIYKMWYSVSDGTNWRTLYTTSANGTTWTTPVQVLNINQEGNWDTTHADSPTVIKDGNTYKMWYSGYDGTNWRILYTKINYMDVIGENDGTASAGVPIEMASGGKVSNAIHIDGSSEYIVLSDNSGLSITGDVTVGAWFKLDTNGAEQTIVGKWDETTANNDRSYRLWIDSSNNLNFSVSTDGSAVVSHIGINTAFLTNTWYHVTGVYDNAGTMNVYVDGSVDATQKSSGVPASIDDNASNLYIGGKENTAGAVNTLLDGFVDEARIYNSALSATEVLALYNSYRTDSNMDLSFKPINIADHDSDTTTTIVNWKKDSSSIYDLLLPFDSQVTDETVDAVLDYSGNANHGTLGDTHEPPTWTSSCIKGGCYDFNGSDERIEVAASTSLDSFSEMSVEAWVNIDDTSTGQDIDAIVVKYDWGGGVGGFGLGLGYAAYFGGLIESDGIGFDLIEDGEINFAWYNSIPSLDTWHHAVGTYDGTDIKFYLDGDLKDTTTTAFGAISSPTDDLDIGGQQSYTRWFNGMIDEVRMYDYALSAEQILQNYNNGKPLYNTIVNQEIEEGDASWVADVTINDAQTENQDSVTNSSNAINPSNSEPVQNFPSARAHALVDTDSVGYWQLEYGDSTQSFDDETTVNDGECTNCPDFTAEGAIGGGYDFNGTDDVIEATDTASLSITEDMTISAWINLDTIDTEQTILGKWDETTAADSITYRLWIDSSNNLNFSISADGSTVASHTGTTTTFAADTWYHVVGVSDNNGATMDVYVDGSVDATQKSSGVPEGIDDNASILYIGGKENTAGAVDTHFDGIIDEPHVYDRVLTATEIENLYNSTSYAYSSYDLGVGTRDMSDADADTLYATVDWRESDTSMAVLNMSFNEEVTTVGTGDVNDYSTYGNDFTLGAGSESYKPAWTGATTCANNSGGCYDFDGVDNYMLDYDSASSSVTGDLTVEAWLKLGTISAEQTILGKWDETTANDDRSYRLWIDSSNNLNFSVSTDGSAVVSHTGTTTTFGTTNWYHVVGVYDNAGTMDVYVDGSADATQKASGVPSSIDDNASNLYIAAKENTSGTLNTLLDGYIDEVRIYNIALSADQISANYNEGIPNYQSIAYAETTIGDVWSAEVTIAEGDSEESVTLESNDAEILGFSTLPYESPESSTSQPTNTGDNAVIKATANVAGSSQWYLAVCKYAYAKAGNDATPSCCTDNTYGTCTSSEEWAISTATADKTEATATYTTTGSEAETNNWYAFSCDKVASTATCSAYSQGSGVTGSPFIVNHRPSIGTVNIGDTTGGTGTIEAGEDVYFNVVVTDADTAGGADTIDMHVCQTNSFTEGSGCDSNQSICYTTGVASGNNAECDSGDLSGDLSGAYNDTGTSSGQKTVYIFLEDSHDLQDADTNTQNYTLSNTVPAFTDGPFDGLLWSSQSGGSEVDETLLGVYFYDANTGWVSGYQDASPPFNSDGVILKTTDGGATWNPQESEVAEILYGINFISSTVGWIVGDNGTILKTTDGGAEWTPQTSGEAGAVLIRVQFVDADNGWAVGMDSSYNAIILKTENGGTNWATVKSNDTTAAYYGIHFIDDAACLLDVDDCQGWVTGGDFSGNEYIYYTDDGGATWNAQSSAANKLLYGVHFYDEDVGWAVGNDGTILKTINGGTNWNPQTSNTTEHLLTVYFLDANNGWAVGNNGTTLKTTNGGTAWSVHASGTDDDLNNVFFVDSSNGWAVGAYGTILKNTGTVVGSSSTNPTNAGSNVNFSATATDANGEQYYLAICKTDAVTAGNNAAPTCDGGAWGYSISLSADSGAEASTYYGAVGGDAESNVWYAFVCDKVVDNAVCSSSSQGTGDSGSPFAVNHAPVFGAVAISDNTLTPDELLTDGDMEAADTSAWTSLNSSTLSKETGTPHGGSKVLRIAYSDTSNPIAHQVILTEGNTYHITGYARGDGTYAPSVRNGSNKTLWTGTTSTSWQYFDETFTADASLNPTQFRLYSLASGSGYAEFDDVSVFEVGTIEPGDTLRFTLLQEQMTETDTEGGQDTINMYICTNATSSFDYSNDSCLGGSLVCSDIGVNPTTTDATCDESGNNLVPIPTAHGSANVKVYVEDNHDLAGTGTNQQSYDVEDVAPVLDSYSTGDSLTIAAGGYDTMSYSVSLHDDNGDNDVTDLEMVFFDRWENPANTSGVNNDCSADDNNCVIENIAGNCTFTGRGDGSDKDLGADCNFTVWFNSTASTYWEAHANPTDGLGQETGFDDSDDDNVIAVLQGITVVEASIAYGTVEIGGTSGTGMETSMGNVGNQVIDMMVDGDDMCIDSYQATCPGSNIPLEQQKWHHSSSTFDWDDAETGAGPWIMEDMASTGGDTDGCLNRDIAVRNEHASTSTNESMYWKLRIPDTQAAGDYAGLNTFTTTSSSSCSGTLY